MFPFARLVLAAASAPEEAVRDVGDRLSSRGQAFLDLLPLLGIGLAVFLLAWFLGVLVSRARWPWNRITRNPFLGDVLRQVVRTVIALVGLIVALDLVGAGSLIGAVLGTAGILGLAIGFAFREIVENYLASILLSLRQPFARDDFVRIEGDEGQVVRLTTRATVLMTVEGNHLRIPNATVYKATILNYTRNPLRRFDFAVGVGPEEDLEFAEETALAAVRAVPGVLADPPPFFRVEALGDSTVAVRLFAWVDQRTFDLAKVRSFAIRAVKAAYDAAGVSLPEPAFRIRRDATAADAEAEATRRARPREEPVAAEEEVRVDHHLEAQIDADRRASEGPDLLATEAPLE